MKLSVSLVLLGLAACLSTSCRSRESSSHDDLKTELTSLERQFADAYLKRDTTFLNRAVTDDYFGINPDGSTEGKAQVLADVGSPGYKMESVSLDVISVRSLGDAALATAAVTMKMTFNGKDLSGKYVGMDVFVKRNGGWQLAASESTRVEDVR